MKVLTILLLTVSLIVLSVSIGQAKMDKDLVLYLSFDEGSGKVAKDLSGNDNDAEVHNAKWVEGESGKALQFGGVDIWAAVPDAPSLNFGKGESLTLECWTFLPTKQTVDQGCLVAKYETLAGSDQFYGYFVFPPDNRVRSYVRDVGRAHTVTLESTISLDVKKWYHVALVRDAGKKVYLYIDGKLEISADDTTGDLTSDYPVSIGKHCPEEYYEGIVDEVMIWRRALSDVEVRATMEGISAVSPSGKLAATWGDIKSGSRSKR